jgi:serine/threonine protein kinase
VITDDALDGVIGDITDGIPVDWGRLQSEVPSVEDRKWLNVLRVLFDVAKVHRTSTAEFEEEAAASTIAPPGATTWGKYRLEDKIGEGSFGNVYRAWDPELELHRALKILHADVTDAHLRGLLLREGRALAKISHENVVKVIGVEAHDNRVALCMDFVRGETLAQVVARQGPMGARDAVLIGKALCGAVLAVHRAGFIHRDIKAKNVMREEGTGRIVLMDFGTGRAMDRPELQGDLAGTPMYMAPEVLEGEDASACSDTYSLGVLLYHLVTGEYPVQAASVEELRDAHAQRRHTLLSERRPDLPIPFMQVIERSIAADPDERYLDAAELLDALGTLNVGQSAFIRVLRWGLIGTAIVAVLPAIGLLTSTHFNILLERTDFANLADDTLGRTLIQGPKSIVAPAFMLVLTLLGGALLIVVRRIVVAMSASARSLDKRVRQSCARIAHRLRLDEVHVLASSALALSAGVMVAAWWYFSPLLTALFTRVSTGDGNDLALLSPAFVGYHNEYRLWFTYVVIVSIAVWIPVLRLVRRGQPLHRGMWVAGAVVTCVAIAFLQFPYRLLYFNKGFEALRWNGSYCYAIGKRGDDVLLVCPEIQPPRNRIVARDDKTLVRLPTTESIFARFHRKEIR